MPAAQGGGCRGQRDSRGGALGSALCCRTWARPRWDWGATSRGPSADHPDVVPSAPGNGTVRRLQMLVGGTAESTARKVPARIPESTLSAVDGSSTPLARKARSPRSPFASSFTEIIPAPSSSSGALDAAGKVTLRRASSARAVAMGTPGSCSNNRSAAAPLRGCGRSPWLSR